MTRTVTSNSEAGTSIAGTHVLGAPLSLPDAAGVDLSTAYGLSSVVTITNGATGPTTGAYMQPMVKHGATWVEYGYPLQSSLTNNGEYRWPIDLGHNGPSAVRVDVYGNASQNVSVAWDWTRTDTV